MTQQLPGLPVAADRLADLIDFDALIEDDQGMRNSVDRNVKKIMSMGFREQGCRHDDWQKISRQIYGAMFWAIKLGGTRAAVAQFWQSQRAWDAKRKQMTAAEGSAEKEVVRLREENERLREELVRAKQQRDEARGDRERMRAQTTIIVAQHEAAMARREAAYERGLAEERRRAVATGESMRERWRRERKRNRQGPDA